MSETPPDPPPPAPAPAPPSETARWLLPALLAPLSAMTIVAALFALFHAPPGQRLGSFVTLAIAGAVFAAVQSTMLLAVDVLAASVRLRRLPGGLRAWGSGGVAPLVALWAALLIKLPVDSHPWLALFLSTTVAALPVRLLIGPRWRAP